MPTDIDHVYGMIDVRGVAEVTKSELIEKIAAVQTQLSTRDVELAVKMILDHMGDALADGERIEIRGFGSFSLHYREPRVGRNPKNTPCPWRSPATSR